MDKLTQKQKEVYDFIKLAIRTKGVPPSVREICLSVNLRSTSSVHAHLNTLEKKGYIKRNHLKNRSIEILEENFYNPYSGMHEVPLLGKVTAGSPILAVEEAEEIFPIPHSFLNMHDEFFMLKIVGDSMIGKDIKDGDLVIVRRQQTANNGDIVVALIEDSATVKTFYKEEEACRLQPENPAYEPIIVRDVSILGKVVGIMRFLNN